MVDPRTPKIGRRVVTGFDSNGKSIIALDGPIPEAGIGSDPGRIVNWVWKANEVPSTLSDAVDPIENYKPKRDWPPREGCLVGIFKWEPGASYPMHTTPTIDVAFVLSGRLELILEKGSTELGPGYCVVMRKAAHSWRVVGDEPAVFTGLMLSTK
jgi:mannose-6-phosphate isomerase-like protein (cupin superfamily)